MFSQNKGITVGIGGGVTRGINESKDSERNLGPMFSIYALYRNGLSQGLTPEFSFNYFVNGTKYNVIDNLGFANYSHYNTKYIMPDLRLRYYPMDSKSWSPFVYGGVGVVIFDAVEFPINSHPESEKSGVAVGFPIGAGTTHYLSQKWSVELNAGFNLSLTDDYNPAHDDIKDGNWAFKFGISYVYLILS